MDTYSPTGNPAPVPNTRKSNREVPAQAHFAEYSALMARSTTFITLQASMWPLMGIYVGIVLHGWRTKDVSLLGAFERLSRHPLEHALMIWGNLFVLGIILKGCSQFMLEQYRIVHYIETNLRCQLKKTMETSSFWAYELYLSSHRNGRFSTIWEIAHPAGYFLVIAALTVTVGSPTLWDALGIASNLIVMVMLVDTGKKCSKLRHEWQTAS